MTDAGGRLVGNVAFVTGAGQGIGREVAFRLAAEGAAIAAVDQNPETAWRTAEELREAGSIALELQADVSSSEAVDEAVQRAEGALGPIAILANVAGIYGRHAPVREQDLENWQRVLAVNLTGTFLCARAVLTGMLERRWGWIVNVASGQAQRPRANVGPYAASKAAVIGFTKALALEVAAQGVTVNAIMPAVTDTAMPRQYGSEERLREQARRNPMGRIGQPADLAAAIAFLVSDDADYITGQTLAVNGGAIMLP
jgi:2-hydroxycyclohexanecarboxyl-CoA dehydrogenase